MDGWMDDEDEGDDGGGDDDDDDDGDDIDDDDDDDDDDDWCLEKNQHNMSWGVADIPAGISHTKDHKLSGT